MRKKIPLLAAALSFIWPGVGQVYNDDGPKGVLFALLYGLLFIAYEQVLPNLGYFLMTAVLLYSIFHAYKMADYMNQAGPSH
ncbi:hypothetical protein G4V62_04670 [Bacillaceae bacterium SIJ1]|uniref:hypothetical protein n=1 Tax=Litoribacterium kuwaitense TaxID=1398745 RepID=UPI0013ED92EA|nr:hypothetical protein [Litoribacterium kuwaitense]NGP44280.1 hypothetical protein [Litoribacterium kuwaitense]